jgi:aryl carrier-like protein
LLELCEDERVCEPGIDLIESGLLDSYAMIELFSRLEEEGIPLQPTRIDRNLLRTPEGIRRLIDEARGNA